MEILSVSWSFFQFHGVSFSFMEFLSVSWSVFKFHGDSFSFMEFLSVSWSFFQFHGVSLSFMEILSVHALPCLKVHMSVGQLPFTGTSALRKRVGGAARHQ